MTYLENDKANVCFICDLPKGAFHSTTAGESFSNHTKKTHYLWNYIYFLISLKQKKADEKNSTEFMVESKLADEDLSWFPVKKTKLLQNEANLEDEEMTTAEWVLEKLKKLEDKVDGLVGGFYQENQTVDDTVEQGNGAAE